MSDRRFPGYDGEPVSRRDLGKYAIAYIGGAATLGAGLILRNKFGDQTPDVFRFGEEEKSKENSLIALTSKDRQEVLKHVLALRSVVTSAINPAFYSSDYLNSLPNANDDELWKFYSSNIRFLTHGSSEWKARFSSDQGASEIDAVIAISYGRSGNLITVHGFEMGTNLLNAAIPELKPYVEEDGKSLVADGAKLRDLANTFFKLPKELSWYPLREGPSNESKVIGVFGKFGTSDVVNPVIQVRLTIDGACEINVLRPLLLVEREVTP